MARFLDIRLDHSYVRCSVGLEPSRLLCMCVCLGRSQHLTLYTYVKAYTDFLEYVHAYRVLRASDYGSESLHQATLS